TTIPVVAASVVTSKQLEGESGLVGKDCSQSPSAHKLINHACAIENRFAVSKGKFEGSAGVDHVPQVEVGGSVTLSQVAEGEHVNGAQPRRCRSLVVFRLQP